MFWLTIKSQPPNPIAVIILCEHFFLLLSVFRISLELCCVRCFISFWFIFPKMGALCLCKQYHAKCLSIKLSIFYIGWQCCWINETWICVVKAHRRMWADAGCVRSERLCFGKTFNHWKILSADSSDFCTATIGTIVIKVFHTIPLTYLSFWDCTNYLFYC